MEEDVMLIEVVIYLADDYSENQSIWVPSNYTREEITEAVNKKFSDWYYYDILD